MWLVWFCWIFFCDGRVLRSGEGRNFHDIIWYHFPKTGGTTMRSLLYQFCQDNSYNLTTSYGLSDECNTLPFSCHIGNQLYFLYGHDRTPFIQPNPNVDSSSESSRTGIGAKTTLKITMLRDPLSWLTSRIQHEMRKNKQFTKQTMSFENAIIQFGPKYFNFLDDYTRQLCLKIFNRLIKSFSSSNSISSLPIDNIYSILLHRLQIIFQQDIFVLQNSYYPESLELLSKLFNNTFGNNTRTSSQPYLNEAFDYQDQSSMGTLGDLKRLNILLELHNHIYYISLQEFIRQRDNM